MAKEIANDAVVENDNPRLLDVNGGVWPLKMTVKTARRIKEELNIDLLKREGDTEFDLMTLLQNPLLCLDIVGVLCEAQIKERGLTKDQFEDLIDDVAELSKNIVWALANFIHGQLKALELMGQIGKAEAMLLERMTSPEMEQRLKDEINALTTKSMTSLSTSTT